MKTKYFIVLIFIFFFFMAGTNFCGQDQATPITLQFAFLYKKATGDVGVINPDEKAKSLSTGERIRIFIRPGPGTFIYLYYIGPDKELSLLFPDTFGFFDDSYSTDKAYFIPGEEKWLVLTPPSGTEEFHLIATSTRQKKLESLTEKYRALLRKNKNAETLNAQQDILDEIRNLKLEGNILSVLNSKPVPIAGVMRNLENEDELAGIEITAKNIYAKTIRIEH